MRLRWVRQQLRVIRSLGFGQAVRIAPQWARCRSYIVFVRDVRRPLPDLPPVGPVRWEPLTEATVAHLRAVDPALPVAEVHRRWAEGQECLLYYHGASPGHYIWTSAGPVFLDYLGRTFHPRHGDYLVVDAFTHPRFRGRGIGALSTLVGLHRAAARGCSRWMAFVAWWNAPALRNARDLASALPVGSVECRLGPWTRSYSATRAVHLDPEGGITVDD